MKIKELAKNEPKRTKKTSKIKEQLTEKLAKNEPKRTKKVKWEISKYTNNIN